MTEKNSSLFGFPPIDPDNPFGFPPPQYPESKLDLPPPKYPESKLDLPPPKYPDSALDLPPLEPEFQRLEGESSEQYYNRIIHQFNLMFTESYIRQIQSIGMTPNPNVIANILGYRLE